MVLHYTYISIIEFAFGERKKQTCYHLLRHNAIKCYRIFVEQPQPPGRVGFREVSGLGPGQSSKGFDSHTRTRQARLHTKGFRLTHSHKAGMADEGPRGLGKFRV